MIVCLQTKTAKFVVFVGDPIIFQPTLSSLSDISCNLSRPKTMGNGQVSKVWATVISDDHEDEKGRLFLLVVGLVMERIVCRLGLYLCSR